MRIAQLIIIQVSAPTLHVTQSERVTSWEKGDFSSIDKALRVDIAPTDRHLLTPFIPNQFYPELHPKDNFPTEDPNPTTSHSK